jgi:hypothetical protein
VFLLCLCFFNVSCYLLLYNVSCIILIPLLLLNLLFGMQSLCSLSN